jgi:TetR/AcrR family transcriptional regulator, transcriptional repressor for nem operon
MRYARTHKKNSRRKIVAVAAREFRRRGIAGFGVGDTMRGAGLTQGAFYAHFSSKEELVREALHEAVAGSPLVKEGRQGQTLKEMIYQYLDPQHRDHPEIGCPAAALIEEVARHPKRTREVFDSDLGEMFSVIEERLPKNRTIAARKKTALAIFSTLLGSLQLARVTPDASLSNSILEAAREAALALAKE